MAEPLMSEAEPGVTNAYVQPEAVGTRVVTIPSGETLVGIWFLLGGYRFVLALEAKDAEAWAWQILDAIDKSLAERPAS